MEKTPIIIDCDPGVDDAQAIILALSCAEIDLKAVCSVTGNGSLENTTRNAKDLLHLCGRDDIPVYRGCGIALDGEKPDEVAAFGDDGLGGCAASIASDKGVEDEHAVDFLVRAVGEHPGELTIFGIGPLTNIAQAARKDPSFAAQVKRLIIMGGSCTNGNMSPVAEYNFWADPLAAHEVFQAGFPAIDVVSFNVTNQIALRADVREIFRMLDTPISRFLYDATREGLEDNWHSLGRPVAPEHDVLAVSFLMDESVVGMRDAYVDVVTEGIARGQSIVDFDGHWSEGRVNCRFAVTVDEALFYRIFLLTVFKDHKDVLERYLDRYFK